MEKLGRNFVQSAINAQDATIRAELLLAAIPARDRVPKFSDQISCSLYGELGPLTFMRAATSWVVNGLLAPEQIDHVRAFATSHEIKEASQGSFELSTQEQLNQFAEFVRQHLL